MNSKQMLKKGGGVMFDQGVVAFGNFCTTLILGRYLLPDEFGIYALAFTTLLFIHSIPTALILSPMIVLYQGKEGADAGDYLEANLLLQILLSLTLSLVVSSAGVLLCLGKGILAENLLELGIFFVLVIVYDIYEFYRMVFFSIGNVTPLVIADSIATLLRIGGLFILYSIGLLHLSTALSLIVLSSIIALLYCTRHIQLVSNFSATVVKKAFRENFAYGKWLLGEGVLYFFSNQVYVYLLAALIDVKAVAAFYACQAILNATNFVMNAMGNFTVPIASKIYLSSGFHRMSLYIAKIAAIFLVFLLGYYATITFFRKEILNVLYNGRYDTFAFLIPIMAFQFLIDFFTRPFFIAFRSAMMPWMGFTLKLTSFIVTLMCAYPFIRYFSVTGAVLGQTTTFSVWLIISILLFVRTKKNFNKHSVSNDS